jgi:hypothetical protein
MSKAARNRTRNARERVAAQQAAARRAERRRRILIVTGAVGLAVAVVVALVVVKLVSSPAKQSGSATLPASVTSKVTNVPVSTLALIRGGSVAATPPPLARISGPPLVSHGKPEMLYIGAEFCPYCAAMRWPIAIALSRFGTFGPLTGIHSSSATTEPFPNTATLTFYKVQYSSPYLTFTEVENTTVSKQPLQPVSKAQQALWTKYDPPPTGPGYPFIDFGNKLALKGPIYSAALLHGLTWAQIAAQLSNPASPVAIGADGAANYLTAAICKMTNNKPAGVCAAAPIPALEAKL